MPLTILRTTAADGLLTLGAAIARFKSDDRLAPVTVIVPTNACGVMARRGLGRSGGVAGVDMVTLNRVAEILAGPRFASEGRQPVSAPVIDLTIRKVLGESPGMFDRVADHPSTIVALRELHQELRLAGPDADSALAATRRGREAVRISRAVRRILARRWYDEADLLEGALEMLGSEVPAMLRRLVVHLPHADDALSERLLARLGDVTDVTMIIEETGDVEADEPNRSLLAALPEPLGDEAVARSSRSTAEPRPSMIVSTTDADDEVRHAVRAVVDAARGELTGSPVLFERIAILWPARRPYARLVAHHLDVADIPWNGRGGVELSERIVPRLLLDLLDVDRHGLRRSDVFDLLADIPARDESGRPLPTAAWERASRAAGVSRGADWEPRLAGIARDERWNSSATSLADFVARLRDSIGHPHQTRTWGAWVDWCDEQTDRWLGRRGLRTLDDDEFRGWEQLSLILERLRSLDALGGAVPRGVFRSVLESEIADTAPRHGRIGHGVTVGSLAGASGLDVDVSVVLGGAEGILPPVPSADPLLGEQERDAAGLRSARDRATHLHHQLLGLFASTHAIVTVPRGDLRVTTENPVSRWLSSEFATGQRVRVVPSALSGLSSQDFPPSEPEHRLRSRLLGEPVSAGDDPVLARALTLHRARSSPALTEYDGDLSAVGIERIGDQVVSPTRLERWAACPHAYFMHDVLGVRPAEEPDRAVVIAATDRGIVQHETLDRFHRDVRDGRLPQPLEGWSDVHRGALLDHFDHVCADLERSGRAGRPATWAVERERMRTDLLGWLDADGERCRERGSTVLDSELVFGDDDRVVIPLPDGRPLSVRGVIDRVDRDRSGRLIVTDHKTGSAREYKKLSENDPTLGGVRLQLPAYAAAARARFGEGAAVRAEYGMFRRGDYGRHGYELSPDVWSIVEHQLGELVDGIESGFFPQVPERPGFRVFVPCRYCEPDELGTADAWSRWIAKRDDGRIARWFGSPDADTETR